jgi:predicted pyridoxine 5'-phosphate oxidase superfamily flavin-nucleotide-binding protein
MIRRSGENRRKLDDPNYMGLERRNGNDRRSVIDRRKAASSDNPK